MQKLKNVQRYAKIRDIPFNQRSLIHREAWFPSCFVRQNQQKNKLFFARRFQTTSKQKCSNVRPLLSITFPQGKSIKFGHWTSRSEGKKTQPMRKVAPIPQQGGPRIPKNPIFLKNGKNHPKRKNSKMSRDMPKQRLTLRPEVSQPSGSVVFNMFCTAKSAKIQTFFCAAILDHFRTKMFKCETTSFHYFSPRIPNL